MAHSATTFRNEEGDFPGGPGAKTLHFQGVQFQSLVGELRFYILHGVDKIRKKISEASLVTQETRVQSLIREDPARHGAAGPVCRSR